MKPTWDKLAEEFNSGSKVLVADVDCTAGGKDLCETYGVQGFPTIKYFNPPDEEGEDYKGARDLPAPAPGPGGADRRRAHPASDRIPRWARAP